MSYISVCSTWGTAAYGYRYVPPTAHDIHDLKVEIKIYYEYILKLACYIYKKRIYHICEMPLFIFIVINLWGPTSDFVFMYRNANGL